MDLSKVRKDIDRVDREIRKLFMERMVLADRVACIKAETEDVIYKPDREESIIRKQTEGVEPKLIREYTALIKRIMEVSRKYQYGRTMELRECFPFGYRRQPKEIERLSMVKEELYLCRSYSKDGVLTVDSYEEVGEKIRCGEADAGMGVIESVGVGVSDELHNLLLEGAFYITNCEIREEKGVRKKIVLFTDELEVLPEHNRIKIVFECPNRSGSLGSILSMISDYGVNLTEIHSRPFKDGTTWNYRFFAELSANMDEKEIRAMLFQLSQETQQLRILGSYRCEGDF
ncbi:MAG: chorismate mutase [Eubacteriales bacterium]|nr:chorismate mutase [Eubacteriales bacterium]